tara:strand:- start:1158 stop:1838 length:681 start_codon:yes stop_codon:yes gene_type:complete
MSNLCIIPARGGSKRIPRKNIKLFLGKPIISYSIKAAIEFGLFDEIIVSTDDVEIAEISKKYGAKVPFLRTIKNSSDFATTYDVIEEVLKKYKSLNIEFDNICCLYPCAPFVDSNILNKAYEFLLNYQYDSVFPIIAYNYPIQRALKFNKNKIVMINEHNINFRSQDLEKSYHDAGQFYWCNVKKILNSKKIFTKNSGGIEISELSAQDIDNEIDWKLAQLKYKLK